jgi:hypothetical protein
VQGSTDGNDIECPDISRQRLGRAFDEGEVLPSPACRCPRRLQHRRFRIDADDAADIRRKAECEKPRSGAEIDKRVLPRQPGFLRHNAEILGRIGRAELLVQRSGGGEAAHAR